MTVQNVDAADTVVAVNMELARSYQPVSYTHLDVYKRQVC